MAVAEHGHFGRAGQVVHLTQPGVTRAIRRLEDELGAELVARGTLGATLTPAGNALLPWARRILGAAGRAVDAVAQASNGNAPTLVVGVSPTSSLAAWRPDMAHPVEVRHIASAKLGQALTRSECDVVVSVNPCMRSWKPSAPSTACPG